MPHRTLIFAALLSCASLSFAQKRPVAPVKKPAPVAAPAMELKAYPIVDLVVTGSERYDADDIIKYAGLKKDKDVETPLDAVQAAAQRLVDSGAFSQVNYKHTTSTGGMKVEFILSDKDDDQFVKCDFANFVWWSENDLLIELHDRLPLFNGTVPRGGNLADDVSNALEALLKEKGVVASVSNEHIDAINGEPSSEKIFYRVADVDIRIVKVELRGASPAMLSQASVAAKLIVGLVYDRAMIKKFIDHDLRNVYLKHGWLGATFAAPEIKVIPAEGAVTKVELTVPVTEHMAYKLHSVRWTGNKAIASPALDTFLHVPPDAPLDGARFSKDLDAIRLQYASFGYLHMTLNPKPAFDDARGTVDYDMQIKEGDLFSMGKFDVEGMQPANAEKIRSAWKLREGDPFDANYLEAFGKRLQFGSETYYFFDELEGERPRSIDVTMIFCKTKEACKPKGENRLYTPPRSDDDK